LIRHVVQRAALDWRSPCPFASGESLAAALMAPTRIYVQSVLPIVKKGMVKGAAHITGGGLIENPPRAVAPGLRPALDWSSWTLPPVFEWLRSAGGIDDHELRRTFNCGVGFMLIVSPRRAPSVLEALIDAGQDAFVCGQLEQA
jgi:phosphoribosylaminoimidazole (AIR) synthetase